MPRRRQRRPRGPARGRALPHPPSEVSAGSPHLWLVGRIGRPVGLAGECVIFPLSPNTEDLERFRTAPVRLVPEGEDPAITPAIAWEGLRFQSGRPIARFVGIDSRDAIAERTHWSIWVDRRDLPPLDEPDTWWVDDLIGCTVIQSGEGGERPLGEVISVIDGPASDFLEVQPTGGRRFNIPLVKRFLVGVDLDQRIIRVDLPDGLTED